MVYKYRYEVGINTKIHFSSCFLPRKSEMFRNVRFLRWEEISTSPQSPCWGKTPCWLSATYYSMYSQLPFITAVVMGEHGLS